MADTRKDKRAPVSLKVRFKSATVDEFIEQYARDISRGGLFIKSKEPMPIGTLLKFEFQLKDESRLIHGVGRVVWKRDSTEAKGDEAPPGMGIKFIKMDPESRVTVERIVAQRGESAAAFEGGGGEAVAAPASTPAPAPHEEAAAPFFPSTSTEAEMPPPEDRTQVRHASEFLASALSAGGADSSTTREAESKAAEARRRTEEIEKQRAAQGAREKTEREAKERQDREAIERAEREAKESAARDAEQQATKEREAREAEEREAKEKKAAAAKAESEKKAAAAKAESGKKAAAAAAAVRSKDSERPTPRLPVTDHVSPPAEEPKSNTSMILVALAAVAVIGVVGYMALKPPDTQTAANPPATGDNSEFGGTPAAGGGETGEPGEPGEHANPATPTPAGESPTPGTATGTEPTPGTPAAGTNVAPPTPPTPPTPPAESVHVRVESTPPGAAITIAGSARGTTPATVDLAAGTAVTLTLRAPGHTEQSREITPRTGIAPVRFTLPPMPFVLQVTSTPDGARVAANGRTANAPGTIDLGVVRGAVTVTATKPGFNQARQTVQLSAFTEVDGRMRASVALTLTERTQVATTTTTRVRPPTPPPGGGTTPPAGGGTPPAGGGTQTPTPPPPEHPVTPPPPEHPVTPPAIPDNPFG